MFKVLIEMQSRATGAGVVALCSVTILTVWLQVLGKTFVMVLLSHSSEGG